MWNNRKQFILGSLMFIGTVTLFLTSGELRRLGVSRPSKTIIRPAQHDHGCYTISNSFTNSAHPPQVLKERSCAKRLPDVLIIGSKKSGTTTLKDFISFHPQIAAADVESHFYDTRYYMGLDWLKTQLPYALPNQLVLEKTPRYFVYPGVQEKMRQDFSPDVKLVVVIRDPVTRAMSDYTHITFKKYTMVKQGKGLRSENSPTMSPEQEKLRKQFKKIEAKNKMLFPNYEKIGDTFEDSILTDDGEVDTNSAIIDSGIYAKHLRKWYQYYSPDQFLVLDGELLITDPFQILRKMEKFLGLEPYFMPDHFHFNSKKRFYCLSEPVYACMGPSKGRPHASVSEAILSKLRQFYAPHNRELEKLLNQTFSWT